MNPYRINEPACISFSGGRSSGYMLYQILQAHGGTLPDHIKVVFANTGKEMPQTLDFVRDCGEQWGVDITWVELGQIRMDGVYEKGKHKGKPRRHYETKIVDYETASRGGEPFRRLVLNRGMPPSPVARFCTADLKVRRIHDVTEDCIQVLGIRGDEPRRAVRLHGAVERGRENYCPMWIAGTTKSDVSAFWKAQSFDLELPNHEGVTPLGNCDLCFLKPKRRRVSIMRQHPELSQWWVDLEDEMAPSQFRPEYTYRDLQMIATDGQVDLFDDPSISCYCGD